MAFDPEFDGGPFGAVAIVVDVAPIPSLFPPNPYGAEVAASE
jgi:hypothetical protein